MNNQKLQKKKLKNKVKQEQKDEIEDERFTQVFTDPRFMKIPQKVKKIEIDDRFKKALTDENFNVVSKVDKYGRKIKKKDQSMQKFYQKSFKKDDSEEENDQKGNKYYDSDGNFQWNEQSSSEQEESDIQEDEKGDQVQEEEEYDWSEQEEKEEEERRKKLDAEKVEVGKRLALTKMDWDNISAVDILALFSSFCKGDMMILKVEIYPSLLGLEKMKNDALYGPSKSIYNKQLSEEQQQKLQEKQEYLSDDDVNGEGYDQEMLRKYELEKMNYYYAVIHCNNKQTAKKIYKEYNGYEFELSNLRLNLSFIADSLNFPQEIKETANEVPSDYQFLSSSLNKAKNHTKIKLTWDQTDPKRQKKLQQINNRQTVDEDEYKEFIANSSDQESDDLEEDQEKIEKYRQKLLGGLSKDSGDIKSIFRQKDLREQMEDDEELDVKFDVGFGEDIGKKALESKKEKKEFNNKSQWEQYQEKKKEKKREKKQKLKEKKEMEKKQGKLKTEEMREEEKKKRAELELLIDNSGQGKNKEDFKANSKDDRFTAILENKEYALDPTHKEYRKVAEGEFVKSQKVKRRKFHEQE